MTDIRAAAQAAIDAIDGADVADVAMLAAADGLRRLLAEPVSEPASEPLAEISDETILKLYAGALDSAEGRTCDPWLHILAFSRAVLKEAGR